MTAGAIAVGVWKPMAKRTKADRKQERRKRATVGLGVFAKVEGPVWSKPPVERMHEMGLIDDVELWAARRFAEGCLAFLQPVRMRGAVLERVDASQRTEDALAGRATAADDYLRASNAMDADDKLHRRGKGLTQTVAMAACVFDQPLSVVEERVHIRAQTGKVHLKRALAIFAAVVPRPSEYRIEAVMAPPVYGLSTRAG